MRGGISWREIEKQPNVFDWTALDVINNYAVNNGFNILFGLSYAPEFYGGGVQQGEKQAGRYLPAAYLPKWDTFISQVVNRYKNTVKYWEIWNEPNLNKFWDVRDTDGYSGGNCGGVAYNRNVGGYLQVLLVAAQRIKAVDPSAHVCAPGVTGLENISSTWNSWIKPVLCMRGGFIDVITHHQYNDDPYDVLAKLD
jgi:hypothetical protein